MTVINNTTPAERGNGMGFLLGVILLLVFLFLMFYYGLPALRGAARGGGTQIQVPEQIDVNVNQK